jgi:hypothetical protein
MRLYIFQASFFTNSNRLLGLSNGQRTAFSMADYFRERFALTQERMASWLGVNRTSLALPENGFIFSTCSVSCLP